MDVERITHLGSLLADRSRAALLCALMDGRAHTGSELARHLGVSPSTVSGHLSKLLDAEMVAVEPQGRHRYWRLADSEIAALLERLGAEPLPMPGTPRSAPAHLLELRTCYDHLAGRTAVAIYTALVDRNQLTESDDAVILTPSGSKFLATLGVGMEALTQSSRPVARTCLDWTERRRHLAGSAGAGLLELFLSRGWVRRRTQPRSLGITQTGRAALAEHFGLV